MAFAKGDLFVLVLQYVKILNDTQGNSTKTCDPWTVRDFDVQMDIIQSNIAELCPYCLPDCDHVDYSSSTSFTMFRWTKYYLLSIPLRRCDSRNLNLSPLCGLDFLTSSTKLQPTVEATYGSQGTLISYVKDLRSPMRKEYPDSSMASHEILSSLVKVLIY